MNILFRRSLKPALILYILKTVSVAVIAFPLIIYFNILYEYSMLTSKLWPLPSGLMIGELLWNLRELIPLILPFVFMIGLIYFLALQFLYGGICSDALINAGFKKSQYFSSCVEHFKGFVKIAIAAVPAYILILSLGDLIGRFLGALVSIALGDTADKIIRVAVLLITFFIITGYLINLRFIQIIANNHSLRFAVKASSKRVFSKIKYFIALNIMPGIILMLLIAISILGIKIIFSLNLNLFSVLLLFLFQQLVVFIWSYIEAFQISLNTKLFKEINHGT